MVSDFLVLFMASAPMAYFEDFSWQRGPQNTPRDVSRVMRPTPNSFLQLRQDFWAAGLSFAITTHENVSSGCFSFHFVIFATAAAGTACAVAVGFADFFDSLGLGVLLGLVFIFISISTAGAQTPRADPLKRP
jgi:hypothetical protein